MAATVPVQASAFRFAAGFSEFADLEGAVREAAAQVRAGLGGATPDLAVIFCSAAFAPQYDEFPRLVAEELGARVVVGTSGMGVIGVGREVEERPAVSISAGVLPGVHLAPFHVTTADLARLDVSPKAWAE